LLLHGNAGSQENFLHKCKTMPVLKLIPNLKINSIQSRKRYNVEKCEFPSLFRNKHTKQRVIVCMGTYIANLASDIKIHIRTSTQLAHTGKTLLVTASFFRPEDSGLACSEKVSCHDFVCPEGSVLACSEKVSCHDFVCPEDSVSACNGKASCHDFVCPEDSVLACSEKVSCPQHSGSVQM